MDYHSCLVVPTCILFHSSWLWASAISPKYITGVAWGKTSVFGETTSGTIHSSKLRKMSWFWCIWTLSWALGWHSCRVIRFSGNPIMVSSPWGIIICGFTMRVIGTINFKYPSFQDWYSKYWVVQFASIKLISNKYIISQEFILINFWKEMARFRVQGLYIQSNNLYRHRLKSR